MKLYGVIIYESRSCVAQKNCGRIFETFNLSHLINIIECDIAKNNLQIGVL